MAVLVPSARASHARRAFRVWGSRQSNPSVAWWAVQVGGAFRLVPRELLRRQEPPGRRRSACGMRSLPPQGLTGGSKAGPFHTSTVSTGRRSGQRPRARAANMNLWVLLPRRSQRQAPRPFGENGDRPRPRAGATELRIIEPHQEKWAPLFRPDEVTKRITSSGKVAPTFPPG